MECCRNKWNKLEHTEKTENLKSGQIFYPNGGNGSVDNDTL